ncbi:hypothetical protein [Geodermatophilus amargosae]|uniref:hypothetical protein n=1 Tax=Geodermatophilus amargosae TaxID=1296565 RepID=UPI0034E02C5A
MVVAVRLPRSGLPEVLRSSADALVPVRLPEQLAAVLADAGLEPVSELRLPAGVFGHPQVLLTARRPD